MKKNIFTIVFGSFVTILYLVYFILSRSYYADEYGTSIDFNLDDLVMVIVGIIIILIGVMGIINTNKNKSNYQVTLVSIFTIGVLMTFYPLGNAFKAISKKKTGSIIADYFVWAILGAFVLAYAILEYLANRPKKENK